MRIHIKNPLFVCSSRNIGDHIKIKRLQLGFQQKDVARILNACDESITGWENGRFKPQLHFYPAIAEFLGYNPFLKEIEAESLADRINSYRKLKGLSLKKFGQLVGVDGSTVSSWEVAETVPRKATLKKLNKILGKAKR